MNEKIEYPWKDKRGDYVLVPVHPKDQQSMMSIFVTYMGVLACIAVLWAGGALGTQFALKDIIVVSVIGSVITAVIGALTAGIGGVSKCSTYINLRMPFGHIGAWVWSAMSAGIPDIGWFAYETWLFGIMINSLAPNAWWADVLVASVWGGLLMMTTAIVGYKGLAFISYLTVPMFIILAAVAFLMGIYRGGGIGSLMSINPISPQPLTFGITEVVGMYIVGAVIAPDISRFSEKWWHGPLAWFMQVMIFQVFYAVGSGLLALSFGSAFITDALLLGGVGIGAYLMAILGQWTTNDVNLYSSALAWNIFIPIRRWKLVVIEGVLGSGIAAYIAYTAGRSIAPFVTFLSILGAFVPAIGGVMISDFYLYRWYKKEKFLSRYNFKPGMVISQIDIVGWLAAILGGVFGGYFMPGIPALNSFLLGLTLYFLGSVICDRFKIKSGIGKFVIPDEGE
jgi:cytosine permease